jgi:hypothetical protein
LSLIFECRRRSTLNLCDVAKRGNLSIVVFIVVFKWIPNPFCIPRILAVGFAERFGSGPHWSISAFLRLFRCARCACAFLPLFSRSARHGWHLRGQNKCLMGTRRDSEVSVKILSLLLPPHGIFVSRLHSHYVALLRQSAKQECPSLGTIIADFTIGGMTSFLQINTRFPSCVPINGWPLNLIGATAHHGWNNPSRVIYKSTSVYDKGRFDGV